MPKRFPRPDELIVDREKITNYLLWASHPDGSSKAKFFSALGFEASYWQSLAEALIQHGHTRDVVEEIETPFGMKYIVQCLLVTPNERNPCIRSVWISERDKASRLVTAYPSQT
jgi:hypothetical protein